MKALDSGYNKDTWYISKEHCNARLSGRANCGASWQLHKEDIWKIVSAKGKNTYVFRCLNCGCDSEITQYIPPYIGQFISEDKESVITHIEEEAKKLAEEEAKNKEEEIERAKKRLAEEVSIARYNDRVDRDGWEAGEIRDWDDLGWDN